METNLNFLFSKVHNRYAVKVILLSRHGDKTPNNHITDECLKNIMEKGMPGLTPDINVIQHGSACVRSDETVSAAMIWILKNGGRIGRHLSADQRLGSDQFFQDLFTPEIKEQMKVSGWGNYETLVNARPDGLMIFEKGVAEGINSMFNNMETGDICLSVSHSPTVETAFNYFIDPDHRDNKMVIAPLDGIMLVQIGKTVLAYR